MVYFLYLRQRGGHRLIERSQYRSGDVDDMIFERVTVKPSQR